MYELKPLLVSYDGSWGQEANTDARQLENISTFPMLSKVALHINTDADHKKLILFRVKEIAFVAHVRAFTK